MLNFESAIFIYLKKNQCSIYYVHMYIYIFILVSDGAATSPKNIVWCGCVRWVFLFLPFHLLSDTYLANSFVLYYKYMFYLYVAFLFQKRFVIKTLVGIVIVFNLLLISNNTYLWKQMHHQEYRYCGYIQKYNWKSYHF